MLHGETTTRDVVDRAYGRKTLFQRRCLQPEISGTRGGHCDRLAPFSSGELEMRAALGHHARTTGRAGRLGAGRGFAPLAVDEGILHPRSLPALQLFNDVNLGGRTGPCGAVGAKWQLRSGGHLTAHICPAQGETRHIDSGKSLQAKLIHFAAERRAE